MSKAVLCIATTQGQARSITDSLKAAGFRHDSISILLADETAAQDHDREEATKGPRGAITGASAGGLMGGYLGWVVGIGTIAIPGVGPLLAAGPIVTALTGLAAGAIAGGVGGALVGLGVPDEDARRYARSLHGGRILLSVQANDNDEMARAREIFEREGAVDISCSREPVVETRTAGV